MHHSNIIIISFSKINFKGIPSMLTPVRPEKDIKKVLLQGYVFGFLTLTIIPLTAILAFGTKLVSSGSLKYYNEDFINHEKIIYYFVSFYMMFNIAAFPVLVITLRNNMMKLFSPNNLPKRSFDITKRTIIYTALILVPVILSAVTLKNYI